MPGLLNREELFLLFQELERELKQRRVRGHIHVVGGAAMALGFREARTTNDIDARIVAEHDAVLDAVAAIAQRRGISEDWLNEKATVFMPERDDAAAQTLFDSPHLVVTGASARFLLAMKLYAARGADWDDIDTLCRKLDIRTPEQAVDIYETVFPGRTVDVHGLRILRTLLARFGDTQ